MKALTPTLSPKPVERGVYRRPMRGGALPFSRCGRRWPEGPDEGVAAIDALDWPALERELDAFGCAVAPKLLTAEDCRGLAALYADDAALPLAHRDGEPTASAGASTNISPTRCRT